MTLPTALSIPVAANLYPDLIKIAYQFLLPHPCQLPRLVPSLWQYCQPSRIPGRLTYRARITCDAIQEPVEVEISKPGAQGPLRFVASINPLRDVHLRRDDYGDERSRDTTLNWPHPEDVREDNRHIAEHAQAMIMGLATELLGIAEGIAGEQRGHAQLEGIYVSVMELTYEFAADDPEAMSHRIGQVIRRNFRNALTLGYRQSACGYQRLCNDTHVFTGFAREGESYTTYPKTNRRVRVECELRFPALKAMGGPRNLIHFPGQFPGYFAAIAERVIPNFLEILEVAPTAPTDVAGPLDLLADLARSIRAPDILRDVLVALAASGRITRNFARRGLGSHLAEAGILVRVGRGTYAIAPRYRVALDMLAPVQTSWLDFTPARRAG